MFSVDSMKDLNEWLILRKRNNQTIPVNSSVRRKRRTKEGHFSTHFAYQRNTSSYDNNNNADNSAER